MSNGSARSRKWRLLRHFAVVATLTAGCGGSPPAENTPPRDEPTADAAVSERQDGRVAAGDVAVAGPAPQGTPDVAPLLPDAPPAPAGGISLLVEAGAHDRANTIVSFAFPAGMGKRFVVRDGATRLPLQLDENGRASFVLPALEAGAQASLTLEESSDPAPAGVTAVKEADGVKLAIGAATVFRYQTQGKLAGGAGQNFLRGGYIHPLYTPGGAVVTEDYPGDHRHHHGIWSAWAHTRFEGREMDFWNMGGGSAKVDFESLASTWEGPVHAGLRARHLFTDLRAPGGAKTALREEWVVTAYKLGDAAPAYFVFDLDSTQEAASASPVNLDQYLYGGFAFRGLRAGTNFLTSEGRDRGAGDGTTARWCYMGAQAGGKAVGYAVLGHPTNFRAPQPMRINPTDPYFSFSPVQMGGFPIMQGKPYVSRFRVVVMEGAPDKAVLDRLWNDYATPPAATVR